MAREAELESVNASGDRSFSEKNLILACGWLNQLRNPRNRSRIGRLEIELLDQECNAVTPRLRIQRLRLVFINLITTTTKSSVHWVSLSAAPSQAAANVTPAKVSHSCPRQLPAVVEFSS